MSWLLTEVDYCVEHHVQKLDLGICDCLENNSTQTPKILMHKFGNKESAIWLNKTISVTKLAVKYIDNNHRYQLFYQKAMECLHLKVKNFPLNKSSA